MGEDECHEDWPEEETIDWPEEPPVGKKEEQNGKKEEPTGQSDVPVRVFLKHELKRKLLLAFVNVVLGVVALVLLIALPAGSLFSYCGMSLSDTSELGVGMIGLGFGSVMLIMSLVGCGVAFSGKKKFKIPYVLSCIFFAFVFFVSAAEGMGIVDLAGEVATSKLLASDFAIWYKNGECHIKDPEQGPLFWEHACPACTAMDSAMRTCTEHMVHDVRQSVRGGLGQRAALMQWTRDKMEECAAKIDCPLDAWGRFACGGENYTFKDNVSYALPLSDRSIALLEKGEVDIFPPQFEWVLRSTTMPGWPVEAHFCMCAPVMANSVNALASDMKWFAVGAGFLFLILAWIALSIHRVISEIPEDVGPGKKMLVRMKKGVVGTKKFFATSVAPAAKKSKGNVFRGCGRLGRTIKSYPRSSCVIISYLSVLLGFLIFWIVYERQGFAPELLDGSESTELGELFASLGLTSLTLPEVTGDPAPVLAVVQPDNLCADVVDPAQTCAQTWWPLSGPCAPCLPLSSIFGKARFAIFASAAFPLSCRLGNFSATALRWVDRDEDFFLFDVFGVLSGKPQLALLLEGELGLAGVVEVGDGWLGNYDLAGPTLASSGPLPGFFEPGFTFSGALGAPRSFGRRAQSDSSPVSTRGGPGHRALSETWAPWEMAAEIAEMDVAAGLVSLLDNTEVDAFVGLRLATPFGNASNATNPVELIFHNLSLPAAPPLTAELTNMRAKVSQSEAVRRAELSCALDLRLPLASSLAGQIEVDATVPGQVRARGEGALTLPPAWSHLFWGESTASFAMNGSIGSDSTFALHDGGFGLRAGVRGLGSLHVAGVVAGERLGVVASAWLEGGDLGDLTCGWIPGCTEPFFSLAFGRMKLSASLASHDIELVEEFRPDDTVGSLPKGFEFRLSTEQLVFPGEVGEIVDFLGVDMGSVDVRVTVPDLYRPAHVFLNIRVGDNVPTVQESAMIEFQHFEVGMKYSKGPRWELLAWAELRASLVFAAEPCPDFLFRGSVVKSKSGIVFSMQGEIIGTWRNVAGIPGLVMRDAGVVYNMTPQSIPNPSGVEAWGSIDFGTKRITGHIFFDTKSPMAGQFLYFHAADVGPGDLLQLGADLQKQNSGEGVIELPASVVDALNGWKWKKIYVKAATRAEERGGVAYTQGMSADIELLFFGKEYKVSFEIAVPPAAFNFGFSLYLEPPSMRDIASLIKENILDNVKKINPFSFLQSHLQKLEGNAALDDGCEAILKLSRDVCYAANTGIDAVADAANAVGGAANDAVGAVGGAASDAVGAIGGLFWRRSRRLAIEQTCASLPESCTLSFDAVIPDMGEIFDRLIELVSSGAGDLLGYVAKLLDNLLTINSIQIDDFSIRGLLDPGYTPRPKIALDFVLFGVKRNVAVTLDLSSYVQAFQNLAHFVWEEIQKLFKSATEMASRVLCELFQDDPCISFSLLPFDVPDQMPCITKASMFPPDLQLGMCKLDFNDADVELCFDFVADRLGC